MTYKIPDMGMERDICPKCKSNNVECVGQSSIVKNIEPEEIIVSSITLACYDCKNIWEKQK